MQCRPLHSEGTDGPAARRKLNVRKSEKGGREGREAKEGEGGGKKRRTEKEDGEGGGRERGDEMFVMTERDVMTRSNGGKASKRF